MGTRQGSGSVFVGLCTGLSIQQPGKNGMRQDGTKIIWVRWAKHRCQKHDWWRMTEDKDKVRHKGCRIMENGVRNMGLWQMGHGTTRVQQGMGMWACGQAIQLKCGDMRGEMGETQGTRGTQVRHGRHKGCRQDVGMQGETQANVDVARTHV